MKTLLTMLLTFSLLLPAFAANDEKEEDRVKESGVVLKEILNIPDDIPQDLLDKAECVIVLPSVKKGAIGIGGSYGRGVMLCRSGLHYTGRWGAPALYALEGINIGFQLGGQATDFVLLVMNPKGAESLLSSKVKLGADASAAAGPKGRTAEAATDVVMSAEFSTRDPKACSQASPWRASTLALRRQRQRKTLRAKAQRKRHHPRRQSKSSAFGASPDRLAEHQVAQEQIRAQVAAVDAAIAKQVRGRVFDPASRAQPGSLPMNPSATKPIRCHWPSNPLSIRYHDEEWGLPQHDDRVLFEFLLLEGAQAGLSWDTILKKRENYRAAFHGFDPKHIARYDRRKMQKLLRDPGIVRNRLKVAAAVKNAKAFLDVQKDSVPSIATSGNSPAANLA